MANTRQYVLSFVYLLAVIYYILYVEQTDFKSIFAFFSISALLCFLYFKTVRFEINRSHLIFTAIILRLLLFFDSPALSDDFYRFYWDAYQFQNGNNPYTTLPSEFMHSQTESVDSELQDIYENLNSKDYHSVYPIGSQLIFNLAYICSGAKMIYFLVVVRLIFLLFECLLLYSCYYLLHVLKGNMQNMQLLIFNPFLIVEFTGNLHFDLIFISLVITALVLCLRKQSILGSVLLSLSVSIKPQALILIPFILLLTQSHKKLLSSILIFTLCTTLWYLPFLESTSSSGFSESLQLYFKTFEFNASIYYFLRWVGFNYSGYNQIAVIGPFLSLFTGLIIALIGIRALIQYMKANYPLKNALTDMNWVFLFYLLSSTTVHPWYIIPILVLSSILSQYWLVLWSFLIFLSYSFYDPMISPLSFVVSLIAYVPVFVFLIKRLTAYLFRKNKFLVRP